MNNMNINPGAATIKFAPSEPNVYATNFDLVQAYGRTADGEIKDILLDGAEIRIVLKPNKLMTMEVTFFDGSVETFEGVTIL